MQRRTGIALGAALVCLGVLSAVAGSIGAPTVRGDVSYEVAVSWAELFEQGDRTVTGFSGGDDARSVSFGENAISTPLGQVVVLTGWLLVAFRKMDAVAGALSAVSVVALSVVLYFVVVGGPPTGGEAVVLSDVPVTIRLWLLATVVVVVSAAVAFSIPQDLNGRAAAASRIPSLDSLGRTGEPAGETGGSRDPAPSDAVQRAWWDLTRRVERDTWATRTPREIERSAAAAGLPEDVVSDLRALFEDVRYGDAPATTEREQRARDLRERIDGSAPYRGTSEDATDGEGSA